MKTLVQPSVDLDSLLEEILKESAVELARIDPLAVGALAAAWGPVSRGPAPWMRRPCGSLETEPGARPEQPGPRAESELLRVHCGELAFLLREGARRSERWSAVEARDWHDLVREALEAARSDDLDLTAFIPSSLNLLAGAPASPLTAVELARTSLCLAEHPLGRLELGRALQRRGHPQAASGVLAAALYGLAELPGVLQARPWPELLGGLARAQECSGHPLRARSLRSWLPGRVA